MPVDQHEQQQYRAARQQQKEPRAQVAEEVQDSFHGVPFTRFDDGMNGFCRPRMSPPSQKRRGELHLKLRESVRDTSAPTATRFSWLPGADRISCGRSSSSKQKVSVYQSTSKHRTLSVSYRRDATEHPLHSCAG